MTKKDRDELKRLAHNADKLIALNLEGVIPWNQGVMDAFNAAASPKAVLEMLAENKRMRELLETVRKWDHLSLCPSNMREWSEIDETIFKEINAFLTEHP